MTIRFLTAGESHGKALIGIIEGLPANLKISKEFISKELKRRKLGYGRGARQLIEDDSFEILSGVRDGKTIGSPISIMIENKDFDNWKEIMSTDTLVGQYQKVTVPRPGHADLVGGKKYNQSDLRNVLERASARETAMRVALGSLVKIFLNELGVSISSRVLSIGNIKDESTIECKIDELNNITDTRDIRCVDKSTNQQMIKLIDQAKESGDTLGGNFQVFASGVPMGLGSYIQWDKRIEGDIAKSFMSLNAIKAVEIGDGKKLAALFGSKAHDELKTGPSHFCSNKTGGIIGGMTTGETIIVTASMKPIATLITPLNSFDLNTQSSSKAHIERSDVCAVPSASVIGESLLALVIANALLEKFGGDSIEEIKSRIS